MDARRFKVEQVFTPHSPIDDNALFAGRVEQTGRVLDALGTKGKHVVIYGQRGVGKTSLANVLEARFTIPEVSLEMVRVNCDSKDDYSSIWVKALSGLSVTSKAQPMGFGKDEVPVDSPVLHLTGKKSDLGTADVRKAFEPFKAAGVLVGVILDEFDRVEDGTTRALMADTVKLLSDHNMTATLVFVGVAKTVDELIAEHESIERNLVQVPMPRMSDAEIDQILKAGFKAADVKSRKPVRQRLVRFSRGLPHYAHLLGKYAALHALKRADPELTDADMDHAVEKALHDAQQSTQAAFERAVAGGDAALTSVLLASAHAESDDMGTFDTGSVQKRLEESLDDKTLERCLFELCEEARGPTLERMAANPGWRYRFRNPLLQPFVLLKGHDS